jgi:hypothetical protein
MSQVSEVSEYMQNAQGGRARSFDFDGVRVLVTPPDGEADGRARDVVNALRESAATIARLERELAQARALIPPKKATRLLTAGPVRQDERGGLWLLSKRETGWAAFGYQLGTWDNLFRHYDVEVYEAGTDKHGPYWMVRNREARS